MSKHNELTGSSGTKIDWELKIGHGWQIVTVDSKIDKHRSCKLLYLVHWLGYENTDEELSWLPATELKHANELVSDIHSAYLQKPSPISKL